MTDTNDCRSNIPLDTLDSTAIAQKLRSRKLPLSLCFVKLLLLRIADEAHSIRPDQPLRYKG
mgnify:CR=1 FL=1